MRPIILTILSAAVLAAAPAAASARESLAPEDQLAKLLKDRVAGEPQNCITLSSVTSSQVIDKTAIVYKIGGTYWVNRPKGAESLDDDDVLVTKTTGSQLCSIDTVQLHDRSSHFWTGFVSLGKFVPYRKVKTASGQ
ncbi:MULTISPECIES: hypothetical protein [unclassified Sphingopyxis]|uniref:hypothetical protein n=1 Tax=unclassified Sphingopyxis TaxID=2614943 RepID=UPI000731239C|nr:MULTISPECIES: hypothetical protein [unclassified Sphingopyxis]KTE21542.1 hypothetical protein ATE61_19090 [Sphingopyxis sp. H057]KTE49539.1 hypothetical protein ATE64_19095 [Sphingopyxis sp. H073]KTE49804.1 hypothetical protein ATE69_19755 [Sphingopyxis sp. H071]KTE58165.1 hypothetical protein ATE66_16060 [Sphingopyxis sp. H107]KTE62687.1 hypothetical protein ATE65_16685 [Sphingopyxis sp. H100]